MKKLNNLLNFNDFSGKLPTNDQKKTKRTDIGLDIIKEGAGTRDPDVIELETKMYKLYNELNNKIDNISDAFIEKNKIPNDL